MEQTKKKTFRWKKLLRGVLIALLVLALALGVTVYAVWHNELSTLFSMKRIRARNDDHLDGAVYEMHVSGGFYLEDFVEQGGVSTDAELIDFIVGHITKGVVDINLSSPSIGCASFTARSADGDALFARNYDFAKTNTCLVFTEGGNGRHASFSTADLQFLGMDVNKDIDGLMNRVTCLAAPYIPFDGMNDAGVAVGIYMSYQGGSSCPTQQDTPKPDFTSTTMMRLILDYADDLDEAIEIASSYDMHDSASTSYHYMVADASGRSAILEWVCPTYEEDVNISARQLVVTYNDDDSRIGPKEGASDFQWVTNFIIQPGYYTDDEQKGGLDRYEQIYADLSAAGGVVADERAAMDILATVGRRSWKPNGSGITVHSVIYNLTEKTVLWVPNENFDDPDAWLTYHLGG